MRTDRRSKEGSRARSENAEPSCVTQAAGLLTPTKHAAEPATKEQPDQESNPRTTPRPRSFRDARPTDLFARDYPRRIGRSPELKREARADSDARTVQAKEHAFVAARQGLNLDSATDGS
jgi:hypothetical protein